MKVNEWAQTYWTIINIKPKTLFDYKALYRRNLEPYIGDCEIDEGRIQVDNATSSVSFSTGIRQLIPSLNLI